MEDQSPLSYIRFRYHFNILSHFPTYMEGQDTLLGPFIPFTSTTYSSISSTSDTDDTTISLSSSTTATSYSTHHQVNCENIDEYNTKGFILSNSGIIIRLLSVLLAAVISIWANYEASKSFEITIINNAKESPAGQRFTLFYVSNDKAIRMILDKSELIEKLLYPTANLTKKHINHVTLRLATHNLIPTTAVSTVVYENSGKSQDYVIDLSPSLLEEAKCQPCD